MTRILFTLFLFFPAVLSAQLIPSDVMPFGTYSSTWANSTSFYTSARMDSMREELGLNAFIGGGFNSDRVDDFYTDGIFPYPWFVSMDVNEDPQVKYAHTTYFFTHPEEDSSQYYVTIFDNHLDGWQVDRNDSAFFAYDGDGVMLGDLRLRSPNRWDWFLDQLEYYPVLGIAISPSAADSDAVVGVFEAVNPHFPEDSIRFVDTVFVRDLPRGGQAFEPISLSLVNDWESSGTHGDSYFVVRNLPEDNTKGTIRFKFETAGICTVYVDDFTIYDQYGKELVADGLQDDAIKQSTGRDSYKDKILGWYLKDTLVPGNYRPFAYINSLIKDTTEAVWTYPVTGAGWLNAGSYNPSPAWSDGFREFLRICDTDILRAYFYPIDLDADYTGWDNNGRISEKFQARLQFFLTDPCDSVRAALAEHDSTFWVYTPQFWYCLEDEECTSGEKRRKPTPSELLCMTYTGMCYHPKSIIFWKYDSTNPSQGIVDANGNPRAGMYEVVRDDINPYLKAIDATYLSLEWQRAYAYHNGTPDFDDPPSGAYVSSISSYTHPDSVSLNPDSGWFHVGEFEDTLSAKYIMLVNRACSANENGDSAPSVTATVKFDPTNLGLGNYVYIIDIAASVFRDTTGEWVGIPDITYSATLDGTIPFTTVLGPGEGRLFKIVGTGKTNLTFYNDELSLYEGY